jgi:hypothetical protein
MIVAAHEQPEPTSFKPPLFSLHASCISNPLQYTHISGGDNNRKIFSVRFLAGSIAQAIHREHQNSQTDLEE